MELSSVSWEYSDLIILLTFLQGLEIDADLREKYPLYVSQLFAPAAVLGGGDAAWSEII
jgi:hypothetical protein